ncbi:MAG: bis(5'-nucleosyl)-tetraphosphatase [Nitrososphaeraceae archaeon]
MIDELSIGAVLFSQIDGKRKYLLLNYVSGHWDFPKGNKEENETELSTIIREIKEETNITDITFIHGFQKNIFYNYIKNSKLISKKVKYYIAKTKTTKVTLSYEHIGYKWESYDKALNIITFNNSKQLLIDSHRFLDQKNDF